MGLKLKELTYGKREKRSKILELCWSKVYKPYRWFRAYLRLHSYSPNVQKFSPVR